MRLEALGRVGSVRRPHQLQLGLIAGMCYFHLLQRILVVRCGYDAVALAADGIAGAIGVGDVLEGEPGGVWRCGKGPGGHCGPLFTRLNSRAQVPVYAVGMRVSPEIRQA